MLCSAFNTSVMRSVASNHFGSPVTSDKRVNSIQRDPISAINAHREASCNSPLAAFVTSQRVIGIRLGVSKATYSMSPTSRALRRSLWSPLRSYADKNPPRYRIVVSKTLISSRELVSKLMLVAAATASSNSLRMSIIHKVSRLSTKVAPLNEVNMHATDRRYQRGQKGMGRVHRGY